MLTLDGVTKSFGGVRALDSVTLELGHGPIEGIIGPNGAGKTTLFRVLAGFTRPDRGTVTFAGEDVTGLPAHELARRGVARTFQEQEVFPSLEVGEVLTTACLLRDRLHAARRRAAELARELHLRWDATPGELSPADVRRLELGRIIAARPRMVLFDEVMAGLTPQEADFMVGKIRELHAHGVAVVVVEHVMEIVMRLCERLHVLAGGRLIAQGEPNAVAAEPAVVEAYLGSRRAALSA